MRQSESLVRLHEGMAQTQKKPLLDLLLKILDTRVSRREKPPLEHMLHISRFYPPPSP